MRRTILGLSLTALAVGLTSTGAQAQGLDFRPVDTTKLVQASDSGVNLVSGTAKILNRAVADTIDNNGFVRTLNNLLGRRADPKATTQPGGLPLPGQYQSTRYQNSFQPAYPTVMRFGSSVPVVAR